MEESGRTDWTRAKKGVAVAGDDWGWSSLLIFFSGSLGIICFAGTGTATEDFDVKDVGSEAGSAVLPAAAGGDDDDDACAGG